MYNKLRVVFCAGMALLALGVCARADSRIEKKLKLEPGGKFFLESSGGDVIVKGGAASGAQVVITANRSDLEDLFEFSFDEEAGGVRIVARRRGIMHWPNHLNMRFEVQVPTRTRLELRTGGGDIRVTHLEGDAELHTSGGDVEVSELKGNLEARTSGGDIRVRQLTGDVDVGTAGGDVRAEDASGRVDAHTSGGDIEVSLARGNSRGGQIETSGGTIRVALDPSANLNLDASASGGDLTTDLPLKVSGQLSHSSLRATLGSGGETLRLHTSGGDIHIRGL
jgi:hypothetical protein